MTLIVAPIVEGHTEQGCLERLLHRVWAEVLRSPSRLQVLEPFRGHRDSFLQKDGKVLSEAATKAALKLRSASRKEPASQSMILVLFDAEDDCPATLGPQTLGVVRGAVPRDLSVACVFAKRMLESWIVAGASTLAGVNGLPTPLPPHTDPETAGAGWLEKQIRQVDRNRKYSKTIDAKEFVTAMHLGECRETSPSFDKLCRELEARITPQPPPEPPAAEEPPSDPPAE